MKIKKIKKAFTLAEVLITLGIIGVVAAMTLPTLIQKQNEKATVTALKKFYSSISQAYMMAIQENGTPDVWYTNGEAVYSKEASMTAINKILPYLKVTKNCGVNQGCFKDIIYKAIDGHDTLNLDRFVSGSRFITTDGMSVNIYSYGSESVDRGEGHLSKIYISLVVDINGYKNPNKMGEDTFSFYMTENAVIPVGTPEVRDHTFEAACKTSSCLGHCEGCAAWVIYNENMDYLHCDDLSWDGKHKCSK